MNKIIIVAVLVAIGYQCCLADEEARKAWMEFHKEMKAGVCKPETTDNALLGKLADCKKNFYNIPADKMAEHEAKYTEMMKDCVKDDEVKAYTKVDLTNNINKFVLMSWCGEGFQKCMHEKYQKAKEAKTEEKADPDHKHHPTAEQKTAFKTCLKNAIKV